MDVTHPEEPQENDFKEEVEEGEVKEVEVDVIGDFLEELVSENEEINSMEELMDDERYKLWMTCLKKTSTTIFFKVSKILKAYSNLKCFKRKTLLQISD